MNLKQMILFTCMLMLWSFSSHALECKKDAGSGVWFPINSSGLKISAGGYGDEKLCLESIRVNAQGVICSWNGANYQPTRVKDGKGIGKVGFGITDLKGCQDSLSPSQSGLVCTWDGNGFVPYEIGTNTAVGFSTQGNSNFSSCVEVARSVHNGFVCAPNGKNYGVYNMATKKLVGSRIDYGWDDHTECLSSIKSASSDYVCIWDGEYFVRDRLGRQVDGLIEKFSDFESCMKLTSTPNKLLTQILENYNSQKSFTDAELFKLFYPKDINTKITSNRRDCADRSRDYHIVLNDNNGNLRDECMPDTIYSWGGYRKTKWFIENLGNNRWPDKLERLLFATHSPIATFGYGQLPIRIKLIKNVKFKFLDNNNVLFGDYCGKFLDNQEMQDTVIVRYFIRDTYTGLDFVLCSPGPIQSWSIGYKEHYDEIVKKYNWIQNHSYYDYEMYTKTAGKDNFLDFNLDSHDFSLNSLRRNLNLLNAMAAKDIKYLFYNTKYKYPKNYNSVYRKKLEHFKTDKPIYYNEK